jgi:hypothetical protein
MSYEAGLSEAALAELAGALGVPPPQVRRAEFSTLQLRRAGERLAEWWHGHERVCVVVPDATRQLPAGLVSGVLGAVPPRPAIGLVGVGLHRQPTAAEWQLIPHLKEMEAWSGSARVELIPDGGQGESVVVGRRDGADIGFARAVVECDGIVVLGTVELHQYAGFSGGVKGVAVGCATPETIAWVHRPALLREPGVRVGGSEGNPFRAQLEEAAAALPPIFEVQVALGPDGAWSVFAGESPGAWREATRVVDAFYPVDWADGAVVAVHGAKGYNLYQASRGVTQLALQEHPPLRRGAPVALIADGREGLGQGAGERAFAATLAMGREGLLRQLAEVGPEERTGGGTQRAFVLAMASARHPVGYASRRRSPELESFGWRFLEDEASVRRFLGTERFLQVPDPIHRLPRLRG